VTVPETTAAGMILAIGSLNTGSLQASSLSPG
jgi:hypothetical protein